MSYVQVIELTWVKGRGMLLQKEKGSWEGYSKQRAHVFSLAESLPGGKKRKLLLPVGLCYCGRVWELPLMVNWFYVIEISAYEFLHFKIIYPSRRCMGKNGTRVAISHGEVDGFIMQQAYICKIEPQGARVKK